MNKKCARPLLPQALCGLLLCFTVFIFAPIDLTIHNRTDLWFEISHFLPVFLAMAAAAFLAIELAFLFLRRGGIPYPLYLLALSLLFGVTVCVYLQGNYLCLGTEALTAGEPVWRDMVGEMAVNLLIWAGVIVASIAVSMTKPKFFLKAVPAMCALILVMEGAGLTALLLGPNREKVNGYYCSDKDEFVYSKNGDVIVVMLDTFDARLMNRALDEDPEYAKAFDDFTYYRNTSSSYTRTHTSMTSFLTGEMTYNEKPFLLYCRDAFEKSRFFPEMIENGMTVQVYGAPDVIFGEKMTEQIDNYFQRNVTMRSTTEFVKEMLCLIGYRYAPVALQPFLLRSFYTGFYYMQQVPEGAYAPSLSLMTDFLANLRAKGVTVDNGRRFFKLHTLEGVHEPLEMNRHMEKVEPEETSRYEQLLGCFGVMQEYFDALKAQGVYDTATIIVLGDHGINDEEEFDVCNPALLVKYPGERGEMRISDAPAQLLDLRATAMYGAELDYAPFGTPVHLLGDAPRERYLMDYGYKAPVSFSFYLEELVEYVVPDHAGDLAAYEKSGRIYKKAE